MIILGLLLLVVAAAFGIDLVWKNDVHIANPTVFGERIGVHSAASLFVVGAITGAVVLLGVALLVWGIRRKGVHAVSRRHERAETKRVREERDQLRVQNAQTPSSASDETAAPADEKGAETAPMTKTTSASDETAAPTDEKGAETASVTKTTPVEDGARTADHAQPQEV